MGEIMALKPFWYKNGNRGTPEARPIRSEQPGLGAHATERLILDLLAMVQTGLHGVPLATVVAVLVAGMQ